jgi:hypothetical protein
MNFYELLGVRRNATTDEIKKAKNAMLQTIHPDSIDFLLSKYLGSGDAQLIANLQRQKDEAVGRTQEINRAWGILSDPVKRTAYDKANFSYIVFDRGSVPIGMIAAGQIVTSNILVQNVGQSIKEPIYIGLENDDPRLVVSLISQTNQRFPIGKKVIIPLPIIVEIKITGATPGTYSNELRFVFDGMSYRIPITYQVGQVPRITAVKNNYQLGDFYRGERTGRKVTLQNSGGPAARLILSWTRPSQTPPDIPSDRLLIFPFAFEVIIDTSNCLPGKHIETLKIRADNQTLDVNFEFQVITEDDELGPFPTL